MLTKRQSNKLDKQINALYPRYASGKQIDIMDIPKLFKDVRDQVLQGLDVDQAVQNSVNKFCTSVTGECGKVQFETL